MNSGYTVCKCFIAKNKSWFYITESAVCICTNSAYEKPLKMKNSFMHPLQFICTQIDNLAQCMFSHTALYIASIETKQWTSLLHLILKQCSM